jgi:cyclophilin family peptidyl-prolyl cis-trans isomerase
MSPPIKKRFPTQKPVRRKGRGRTYLLIGVLLAIAAGAVGVYVFESSSTSLGDFALSAPARITILTNATTTSVIDVTATNGFRGTVRLSASLPKNVTATINPENITGSGTATLTMSATFPGNYSLTVTGSSGALTHSVTPTVATPVYATLTVTNGTVSGIIEVELYRAETPKTVSNFVTLAQSHFYDNLVWHRIASNPFVIQTGDPYTKNGGGNRTYLANECCYWGTGGSSQTVPQELDKSLSNVAGTLGMARGSDVNSATSQFYINYADNTSLDTVNGGYAVFGRIIKDPANMVRAIANHAVDSSASYPGDREHPLDPLPYLVNVVISYSP